MSQKKPYTPPKIFQVELNQEQAILSTCSTGTTNPSARTTTSGGGCSTACKKLARTGGSAAHPS